MSQKSPFLGPSSDERVFTITQLAESSFVFVERRLTRFKADAVLTEVVEGE